MVLNFSAIRSNTLLGRSLRKVLSCVPPSAKLPIVQGVLRGKRWIVGSTDRGCWLGSYELDKQKRFCEYISEGDTVYDVGANVGFYTLLASVLVGRTGNVIACEPSTRNLAYLRSHLELNRIQNALVCPIALSDFVGTFGFDEGSTASVGRLEQSGLTMVTVGTLDGLVIDRGLPLPNVIKIDVEGEEASVLRGAAQTIAKARPTIFIATHGELPYQDVLNVLTAFGYVMEPVETNMACEFIGLPTTSAQSSF